MTFPTQTFRYIQIVQTGSTNTGNCAADPGPCYWWSIAQINVYSPAGDGGTSVDAGVDSSVDSGTSYAVGSTIQCVNFTSENACQDENGNTDVGYFNGGSWLAYSNVTLTGVQSLVLNIAAANSGGVFTVNMDSPTGTQLGSYTVSSTGGWTTWANVTVPVTAETGVHTLYIVGAGTTTGIANFKTITLSGTSADSGTSTDSGASYAVGSTIQCVNFTSENACQDENGNTDVGYFNGGSWLAYSNVTLTGVQSLVLNIAAANSGGVFTVNMDSATGTQLGSYTVSSTGGWTTWANVTVPVTAETGVHTLYIVGAGTTTGIANFKTITLSGTSTDGGTSMDSGTTDSGKSDSGTSQEAASPETIQCGSYSSGSGDPDRTGRNRRSDRIHEPGKLGLLQQRHIERPGDLLAQSGEWERRRASAGKAR